MRSVMWKPRVGGWRVHFSSRMWLLLALLALLPVMALIQYRWIGQVSDAAGQRAKARLEHSLEQLITEFDGEITRAHLAFWQMPSEEQEPSQRFAERYREWTRLAPYPQLIHEVYLIETAQEPWRLSRIDASGQIAPSAEWPAGMEALRPRLEGGGRGGPQGFRRGGFDDLAIHGNPAFLVPLREPRGEEAEGRRRRRTPPRPIAWALVAFDTEFILREFLPDLTRRLFTQSGESDYELLVVKAGAPESVVFQSDPAPAASVAKSPDATAGLFAMRPGCFAAPGGTGGLGGRGFGAGAFPRSRGNNILTQKPAGCGTAARALGEADGAWTLLVKHRAGSLGTAVATFRLRTMAISFGVLLVLALGITMLTISTERARVLAKLQMEFAMGISHELRTPLTVIRVAADNLANGMMENTRHAQKYGRLIGDEARRLTDMVEQILTYARTQSPGRSGLEPAPPEQIVGRAIAACGPALREAGVTVERVLEPGLPEVMVDANLIVDCVQNLLNNAVKYAAGGGWVRVRAEFDARNGRVRIAVEDRGPGIAPGDLPHLFDPFYRGEAVRNSQVPGVGLGLSLVKRIVEAHHGTVEVESSADSGTTFSLYLPARVEPVPPVVEIKEVAS